MEIQLKNTIISKNNYPFMVAEIGANHMGNQDIFMETISEAIKSGANGIKLQTYTAESMTLDCDTEWFIIKEGPWAGMKLWDLYSQGALPREWHYKAFEFCNQKRVECFSTPFSENDVDFLEKINCPIYKVASFELTHTRLIEYISKTNKPVILSTGMADTVDLNRATDILNNKNIKYVLLHCTSAYPTPTNEANVGRIKFLSNYSPLVGYSDHTLDNIAASGAVALGAVMIEKHFTLDRRHGLDAKFSMTPIQFSNLVDACINMYSAVHTPYSSSQDKSRKFRRSFFASKDIEKGEVFTNENTTIIRPSDGVEPYYYNKLIGEQYDHSAFSNAVSVYYHRAKFDIKRGHPITHDAIDPPLK